MRSIGDIKKQIDQIRNLSSIITTMKNISIVSMTHYERKMHAVRQYFATVEQGFQIFLHDDSDKILNILEEQNKKAPPAMAAIVLGSEKGLCGEFNEKLYQFFHKSIEEKEEIRVIAIGNKMAMRFQQFQIQTYEFPSSHEEILHLLKEILLMIQEWMAKKQVGEVVFFHNQLETTLSYESVLKTIFPLNLKWLKSLQKKPWISNSLPFYQMEKEELFYELTQELLFINMYRSFIESLASENAGRLSSMQMAENNIQDRLSELENTYHLQRQSQITEELYDILSGFEALKAD